MDVRIRDWQPDDRAFIREMLALGVEETYPEVRQLGNLTRRDLVDASFARYWDDPEKRIWIAVRQDGGRAGAGGDAAPPAERLGCLWMTGSVHAVTDLPDAFVVNVAVAPGFRRQGLARALLAHGLAWYRGRGVRHARLFANASNDGALALYRSFGFEPQTVELRASL